MLLGVGLVVAVPVGLLDAALLGPSGGGWISLDLRGLLIGAYAALFVAQAITSTLIVVAVARGRSTAGTMISHASAAALLSIAAIGWLTWDDMQDRARTEAMGAAISSARAHAPEEIEVVSWRVVERRQPTIELTLRARATGRFDASYTWEREYWAESPVPPTQPLAAGEQVTVQLQAPAGSDRGDVHILLLSWRQESREHAVDLVFCSPRCPPSPSPGDVLLELPPLSP